MTSRQQRADTIANRDEYSARLAARGHAMVWELGENANRKGYAYHWVSTCDSCGATMSVGASWTSCTGVRDARKVECSGPGTAILTDIESAHASRMFADAVAVFVEATH